MNEIDVETTECLVLVIFGSTRIDQNDGGDPDVVGGGAKSRIFIRSHVLDVIVVQQVQLNCKVKKSETG